MAFDSELADRIRNQLGRRTDLTEVKQFGGIGFLIKGNLCCGVLGKDMILRVDPVDTDKVLAIRHTR